MCEVIYGHADSHRASLLFRHPVAVDPETGGYAVMDDSECVGWHYDKTAGASIDLAISTMYESGGVATVFRYTQPPY